MLILLLIAPLLPADYMHIKNIYYLGFDGDYYGLRLTNPLGIKQNVCFGIQMFPSEFATLYSDCVSLR